MSTSWPRRSRRRTQLPHDWAQRRAARLARDGHRCTWTEHGQRCTAAATDVDHIDDELDHGIDNLRSLCSDHHGRRTAVQGNLARGVVVRGMRPREPHPGLGR